LCHIISFCLTPLTWQPLFVEGSTPRMEQPLLWLRQFVICSFVGIIQLFGRRELWLLDWEF
jgi:hypothetical protein